MAAKPLASFENPINFGPHPQHTGLDGTLHSSVGRIAKVASLEQAGVATTGTMWLRGQTTDRSILLRSPFTRSSFIAKVTERDRAITYGAHTKNQELQHV
jgi:hypothetical protein